MPIAHLLEDLSSYAGESAVQLSSESLEETKAAEFERGYTSGWDDAIKSQASDQARILSEFSQALQDLTFQHTEIQARLLKELRPLIAGMVETLFPGVARESLAATIIDQVTSLARKTLNAPMSLSVSESDHLVISGAIETVLPGKITLRVDPGLVEGQVRITHGAGETEIDYSQTFTEMARLVSTFFDETEKELAHD